MPSVFQDLALSKPSVFCGCVGVRLEVNRLLAWFTLAMEAELETLPSLLVHTSDGSRAGNASVLIGSHVDVCDVCSIEAEEAMEEKRTFRFFRLRFCRASACACFRSPFS